MELSAEGDSDFFPNKKPGFDRSFMIYSYDDTATADFPLFIAGAISVWLPLDGYISEFIVVPGSLQPAAKASIQNYLKVKYQLK